MGDIDKFLKTITKRKRRVSSLKKYEKEIIRLREENCSYEQISQYLLEYKRIKICKNTICEFYNKVIKEKQTILANSDSPAKKQTNHTKFHKPHLKNKTKDIKKFSEEEFLDKNFDEQVKYLVMLHRAGDDSEVKKLKKVANSIVRQLYAKAKDDPFYEL